MKKILTLLAFLAALSFYQLGFAQQEEEFKPNTDIDRSKVPDKFKWNTSHIFASREEWENEFTKIVNDTKVLSETCKGNLGTTADKLLECYDGYGNILERLSKVNAYSGLNFDQDKSQSDRMKDNDKTTMLWVAFDKEFSFLDPEIKEIGEDKIFNKFLIDKPSLDKFRYSFNELFRLKDHILSEKEERIKAMAGEVLAGPSKMGDAIDIDLQWEDFVADSVAVNNVMTAEMDNINVKRWGIYRVNPKRWVRKNAAEAFLGSLMAYGNIWARNLVNAINGSTFSARTSNFKSALEMKLRNTDIPVEVHENLIKTVSDNLPGTLHRYVSLKKRVLKLDDFRFYDNYASMIPSYSTYVTYNKSKENIINALKPLGKEYVEKFSFGSDPLNGWVDIYPNKDKESGASSTGVYNLHSYVRLNHENTYRAMFTVAHEFGHALNNYYSNTKQPFVYFHPATFNAEVASTTNEMLLYGYLIRKAESSGNREELLYLYDSLLDNIRQTIHRQTQFAEFEKIIHEKAEEGEPLDLKTLNQIYADLIEKYYGPDFVLGDEDGIEWAFVTHFYRLFYVYTYATSMAASIAFVKKLEKGEIKSEKYLDFLRAGSSAPPCEILKKAGVDMTSPEPIQKAMDYFAEILGKFEKLYSKGKKI